MILVTYLAGLSTQGQTETTMKGISVCILHTYIYTIINEIIEMMLVEAFQWGGGEDNWLLLILAYRHRSKVSKVQMS